MAGYFAPSLARILDIPSYCVRMIGDDDWRRPEVFTRTPKADFEAQVGNARVRLEFQSGFQGINDVKQHKVLEARRLFKEHGKPTICIHADIYNGMVAAIRLDSISEDDAHWITRQQMEGQTVFNIDQNFYCWRLTEAPPLLEQFNIVLS